MEAGVSLPGRLRRWRSTSGRLVLLNLLLSLVCILPILFYLYIQIDRVLIADFARPLEFRQSNLERSYARRGMPGLVAAVASRAQRAHRDQTAILLVDSQGRRLAGNLRDWPPQVPAPQDWTPTLLRRDGAGRPEEFLVRTMRLPTGHRLLLGGLLDNRADIHRALLLALLAAFALAVPAGLVGSLAIVREMNRMVAAIADIGEHVGAGQLHRRATIDGSGDPTDRLKISLNGLLDRIEALVGEHRVLTDALAHDLRSPLTRVQIQITHAEADAAGTDQSGRFQLIGQEVSYVLRILEGALAISRAESGIGGGSFEPLDLGRLLRDLAEIYQPFAATCGVAIHVVGPAELVLDGDRALIARAVANLVDNALKYGAGGREVVLEAARQGRDIHICVCDRAAGISPERREEAVRRFGRLDSARSTPGSGLGLALVKAVASLHGGRLQLEDNAPGLRARLILARQPAANEFL